MPCLLILTDIDSRLTSATIFEDISSIYFTLSCCLVTSCFKTCFQVVDCLIRTFPSHFLTIKLTDNWWTFRSILLSDYSLSSVRSLSLCLYSNLYSLSIAKTYLLVHIYLTDLALSVYKFLSAQSLARLLTYFFI